jgi:hypothetical protein
MEGGIFGTDPRRRHQAIDTALPYRPVPMRSLYAMHALAGDGVGSLYFFTSS